MAETLHLASTQSIQAMVGYAGEVDSLVLFQLYPASCSIHSSVPGVHWFRVLCVMGDILYS